jgi:signal transduction histidine kinase
MNFLGKFFRGSRSIRQRLFWRLGVLSLGTLSIVNLIWLPSSIREIRQSQAELQRVAVRSVRDQIQLFLDERERQLKSQAVLFSAPFVENNQQAVRLLAHRFLQRDPALEEIGIVDREGKERFRLSRKLVITDRELRDLSVTPFYQDGMRGKVSWGSVFTTETSEPLVTLAVPLQASETTTIGVLFGVLSLKSFWDLTGEFNLTYGGRAYIVEQTGRVIAAGDSSLVLRQLSFGDRPLVQQLTQPASSAAYSFVQDVYVNENKVSVTATGLLLPGPRWAVVVEQSQALLYSPVRQKLWLSLGISFIGLLVSFGLARSLSSRLSGPIIRLREGVKLIGHGQLKHRVVVEAADEVGELATHFNAMAESLEEQEAARKQAEERTQRQLQQSTALHEINLAVTSTLDLHAVLRVLMEKIDVLLPYTAVQVWLVNQESQQLERAACWNLDEAEWKRRKLRDTPSLVKAAINSKNPVVALNVQTDPRTLDPEFYRRQGLVSYLGVPLVVKGKVLGVLVFLTREEHRFTDEEIQFLSILAGQAAMAIHNSQLYEQTKRQAVHNSRLLEQVSHKTEQLEEVNHQLSALCLVATVVNQTLEMNLTLRNSMHKVLEIFNLDAGRIYIFDQETKELRLAAQEGFPQNSVPQDIYKPGVGLVGRVFETGEPLFFKDIQNDGEYQRLVQNKMMLRVGYRAQFYISVRVKGRIVGVMSFAGKNAREFSPSERGLIRSIADHIGIAVENATLFSEVRQKTVELEKANRVKDEFLGFVSHELKTPVNTIFGYTEMIQSKMLGEINSEQERALRKVIANSRDLLNMINTLLEATKIEAGAVQIEIHDVDLGNFFEELRSAYDVPLNRELTLIWDYHSDLPVVKSDSEKLKHVLQNLINNAIKYTDKGSVTVFARHLRDSNLVEFKVTDTGIGIPEEALPFIFEMFRQVNGSETRSCGGVGLGLHIVKKFTELLGGKIEVETKESRGSTFTVSIPCTIPPSAIEARRRKGQRGSDRQDITDPSPSAPALRSARVQS